jgi:hypothetical protein
MMLSLFAQAAPSYSVGQIAIAIVIIAAVVGIVLVALKAMKVEIPQWVINILCIVGVAVVAILAIKFVLSI